MDRAGYRVQIAQILQDAGNALFTTTDVDDAIRRALRVYNQLSPRRLDTNLTLAADGREITISSVTGLRTVERVWVPYYSSEPDNLPDWKPFEQRLNQKLFVLGPYSPQTGDVLRLYYTADHTIKDIDSATATTLPATDEVGLCEGAAAFAAQTKGRASIGAVNTSGYTPIHWLQWVERQMQRWENFVAGVRLREALLSSGPVGME